MIFEDFYFSIKWAEKGQWTNNKVKKLLIEQFGVIASEVFLGWVFLVSYKSHRLGLCVQPTVLWEYPTNWTLLQCNTDYKQKNPTIKCITKEEVFRNS